MALPVLKKVAGLIPSMSTGSVLVERKLQPTKDAYHQFKPDPAPQYILVRPVIVYQLSGKELSQLPEANYNRATIIVETLRRIFVADGQYDADVIIYKGLRYKVINVEDYEFQGAVWITTASLEDLDA
jgi:hypothetical protein